MYTVRFLLLLVLLLMGCGAESKLDVATGRYRARVEGSLTDTLSGPAVYRQGSNRVGIELGQPDGAGLSIELGPRPLRARTYDVVAAELLDGARPDGPRGLIAFLSMGDARLEAVRGSLSVTRTTEGEVGATFDFEMEGFANGSPDDLSVRVRGRLRATAE